MKVTATPSAERWLKKQGGSAHLWLSPRHGCCGGTSLLPVGQPGEPDHPEDWYSIETRELKIYLSKTFKDQVQSCHLTALGFSPWKKLFVDAEVQSDTQGEK